MWGFRCGILDVGSCVLVMDFENVVSDGFLGIWLGVV